VQLTTSGGHPTCLGRDAWMAAPTGSGEARGGRCLRERGGRGGNPKLIDTPLALPARVPVDRAVPRLSDQGGGGGAAWRDGRGGAATKGGCGAVLLVLGSTRGLGRGPLPRAPSPRAFGRVPARVGCLPVQHPARRCGGDAPPPPAAAVGVDTWSLAPAVRAAATVAVRCFVSGCGPLAGGARVRRVEEGAGEALRSTSGAPAGARGWTARPWGVTPRC